MNHEEALDFIYEYRYGQPCEDWGYLEMLELTYDLGAGDRVLSDTRILRARDYLEALSVVRRWTSQQEGAKRGRDTMEQNLAANAYALALIQHAGFSKERAAKEASIKYDAAQGSVRRYLQTKDENSPP